MLECVINVSEGRDRRVLDQLTASASAALLDRHADPHHNRSVFTLGGPSVFEATCALATTVVEQLDLSRHEGVHPRLGVLDVVPFVPVDQPLSDGMDLSEAVDARDRFAAFAAEELALPCFLYGPERSLPEIRRRAFVDLAPDLGPAVPGSRSGSVCVGARSPLRTYNVVLRRNDLALARTIARAVRSPSVRSLGFAIGDRAQVSCNLVAPWRFGPADLYDAVAAYAEIESAELVGLIPEAVLGPIDPARYAELDLDPQRTVEARLARLARGEHR